MSTWAFDTIHLENAHQKDDYLLQMTAFWSQSLFGGLHARKTNANLPPHAVVGIRKSRQSARADQAPRLGMSFKKKAEPGLRIVRIFPHSTYSYTIFQPKPVHRSASLIFSPVYHAHMNPSASSKYVRGALSMNLSASSIYVRGALSMNPSASLISNQLLTCTTMAPHSLLIINLFYHQCPLSSSAQTTKQLTTCPLNLKRNCPISSASSINS